MRGGDSPLLFPPPPPCCASHSAGWPGCPLRRGNKSQHVASYNCWTYGRLTAHKLPSPPLIFFYSANVSVRAVYGRENLFFFFKASTSSQCVSG